MELLSGRDNRELLKAMIEGLKEMSDIETAKIMAAMDGGYPDVLAERQRAKIDFKLEIYTRALHHLGV